MHEINIHSNGYELTISRISDRRQIILVVKIYLIFYNNNKSMMMQKEIYNIIVLSKRFF